MPGRYLDARVVAELKELLGEGFPLLVERYVGDCGKRMQRLKSAVETSDFATIFHESHGVKGSSKNIGATRLGVLCAELEHNGQAEVAAGNEQLFAAIEQEFADVCCELENLSTISDNSG